jgi:hypothetical protein
MGSTVALVAVIALRLLPWMLQSSRLAIDTLQARRALLAQTVADLNSLPALEDSAKVMTQAAIALAPRLLTGAGDGERLAVLQGRLNVIAVRHQLRLERVDPVPDSTVAGNLSRVTVDATFEGDVRGLVALMSALSTDVTAMAPTRLRVVAGDPSSPRRLPESLRIEVRLTAWAFRPEGA